MNMETQFLQQKNFSILHSKVQELVLKFTIIMKFNLSKMEKKEIHDVTTQLSERQEVTKRK